MTNRHIPASAGMLGKLDWRRRQLVALPDVRVAAAYPFAMRLWRRPTLRAAVIAAALLAVLLLQPRTHLEWKYSHVLWDCQFCFIQRELAGELLDRVWGSVSIERFFLVFGAVNVALVAIVAAAPLTGLFHEVNLVIVCPFVLATILVFEPAGPWRRLASALALCATAVAVAIVLHWLLPVPLRRGPVAWGLLTVVPGFLPLYAVGTDSFRWLALQANVVVAFAVVAVARFGITRIPRGRIYLVILSVKVPETGV